VEEFGAAAAFLCSEPAAYITGTTLLIDGVDPFAGPAARASLSCRLYRDAAGRAGGAGHEHG